MAKAKPNRKSVTNRKAKLQAQGASSMARLFSMVLFVLALGASGGFCYQYMSQPGKLPLRVIEIKGEFTHLQRSEIEGRVAKAIDGGFFTVDMAEIREAVIGMPWVGEVSVRRVWPDTLRMQVTEQQALAYWGKGALLNLRGEIFRPEKLPNFTQLPRLRGDDRFAPEMVEFYLRLYSRLAGAGLQLEDLQLNARKEWQLHFSNDLRLLLGRESVEQRLQDFFHVYPQLRAQLQRKPQRIDMRYEHGFAVQWVAQVETKIGALLRQPRGGFDG